MNFVKRVGRKTLRTDSIFTEGNIVLKVLVEKESVQKMQNVT